MRLLSPTRLALGALVAAAALSGCATTTDRAPHKEPVTAESMLSHQVALMPYQTQGISVAGTTNWYDGQTHGLKAYATHGGIIYIDQGTPSAERSTALTVDDLRRDGLAHRESTLAAQTAAACLPQGVTTESTLLGRFSFHFASDSKLYKESEKQLALLLAGSSPNGALHVVGYTDDRGNDDINLPLSAARAESVAKHIRAAWPENTVTTEGRGGCPRLASNADADGRARNRRVEIYLLEAR